jgi:anti-sigma factor RsiW
MTCLDFVDFLIDYYEDRLGPEEKRIFDEHLAECDWCRAYLAQYRDTILLGRSSLACPEAASPPEPPEELIKAILAACVNPEAR